MDISLEDFSTADLLILAERLCGQSNRHGRWLAEQYSNTHPVLSKLFNHVAADDELLRARFEKLCNVKDPRGNAKSVDWSISAESLFTESCQTGGCYDKKLTFLPCALYYKTKLINFFLFASMTRSNSKVSQMWTFAADLQGTHRMRIVQAYSQQSPEGERVVLGMQTQNLCPWLKPPGQQETVKRKKAP